ncbi:MAG: fumarate hydratase [Candidatus Margulisbacteria bacterium]|jgi:fumarate hydratase subunit alpha|nr:fumarate hydratase [Candidatus Margulisiibacteriota bacterium]
MRELTTSQITAAVQALCLEANTCLGEDVKAALSEALKYETSPDARELLRQISQNAEVARHEKLPLCQDTGTAVVFVEFGQEVHLTGGTLAEAVNEGVRQGYQAGLLRKSIAADPLKRGNTGDNTPAIVHLELVPGDQVKIGLLCKGGGAENKSAVRMFTPTTPVKEIEDFVLETIKQAGPDACPPLIVGIGIGGNFDSVTLLAKKALLRTVGQHHSAADIAEMEKSLFDQANKLGIGPMGLGGRTTVLAVNIERRPCHISSLPVAVNIECHAHRYKHTVI